MSKQNFPGPLPWLNRGKPHNSSGKRKYTKSISIQIQKKKMESGKESMAAERDLWECVRFDGGEKGAAAGAKESDESQFYFLCLREGVVSSTAYLSAK